jgi:hypothetical protein
VARRTKRSTRLSRSALFRGWSPGPGADQRNDDDDAVLGNRLGEEALGQRLWLDLGGGRYPEPLHDRNCGADDVGEDSDGASLPPPIAASRRNFGAGRPAARKVW